MLNPITRIRKELELPKTQFAQLMHTSYSSVDALEKGRVSQPSKQVLKRLSLLGYDSNQIAKEYKAWRDEQAAKILNQISPELAAN